VSIAPASWFGAMRRGDGVSAICALSRSAAAAPIPAAACAPRSQRPSL